MLTTAFNIPKDTRKTNSSKEESHISSDGSPCISDSKSPSSNLQYPSTNVTAPVKNEHSHSSLLFEHSDISVESNVSSTDQIDISTEKEADQKKIGTNVFCSHRVFYPEIEQADDLSRGSSNTNSHVLVPIEDRYFESMSEAKPRNAESSSVTIRYQLPSVRPISTQPSETLTRLHTQKVKCVENKTEERIFKQQMSDNASSATPSVTKEASQSDESNDGEDLVVYQYQKPRIVSTGNNLLPVSYFLDLKSAINFLMKSDCFFFFVEPRMESA